MSNGLNVGEKVTTRLSDGGSLSQERVNGSWVNIPQDGIKVEDELGNASYVKVTPQSITVGVIKQEELIK